ncbi:MAG: anti-sigma factor family protein [Candidatus Acidiferrales bacterium]
MKDSEFTALLNLYLDHEISAADAARLEREVQGNPARRRVYQDYCRMQKACKILAHDFAEDASSADHKIVAFEQAATTRARRNRAYFVGTLAAAAACVAAVFVLRHGAAVPSSLPTNNFVQTTPQPAPAAEVAPVMVATSHVTATPAQPDGPASAFSLRRNAQEEALALAVRQTDPQFAWLQNVRLEPVQVPVRVDSLRFDSNPNLRPDNRTFSSPRPLQSEDIPWTAIRYQR